AGVSFCSVPVRCVSTVLAGGEHPPCGGEACPMKGESHANARRRDPAGGGPGETGALHAVSPCELKSSVLKDGTAVHEREQRGEAGDVEASETQLRQAEFLISYVLRGGVLLSAGVILLGVILFYGHYIVAPQRVDAQAYPHSLAEVTLGVAHG